MFGAPRTGNTLNLTRLRAGEVSMPSFGEFVRTLERVVSRRSRDNIREIIARKAARGNATVVFRPKLTDQHFAPQSEHCGLWPAQDGSTAPPSALPSVHFILSMSKPGFHADLDELFSISGLAASLRQAHFPSSSGAAHRTSAATRLGQYYDQAIARSALEIYAQDYDTFGLARPDVSSFSPARPAPPAPPV